ncbi:MAG: 2-oxo acid dehydrogenase subunit E2 [Planctomycetota bacterium]
MPTEIKLPSLGENIESGDVLSILVSEGDAVEVDQDLIEIETDKATMPVPSPEAGTITKIVVSEGDTVDVGAVIFEIEAGSGASSAAAPEPAAAPAASEPEPSQPAATEQPPQDNAGRERDGDAPAEDIADGIVHGDGESEAPTQPPAPAAPALTPAAPTPAVTQTPSSPTTSVPAASPAPTSGNVPGDGYAAAAAGPAVRRLARELGVDLRRVRPGGEGGRITEEDVQAHVRHAQQQAAAASASSNVPGMPSSDGQGATRVEKMSRMRQTIAKNMVVSATTIPQLTNFDDVDVTELEEMRQQSKEDYAKRGLKLSQMPFLIKAFASALKLHPIVNASVDMDGPSVIYKEYVNIGIAVDTPKGLMVPVIRDADRLSFSQIAAEMDRLVTKAREGSLAIDEMRGGTFTISNMGAVGGTYSTPIINPPEVAIALIGRSRMLPTVIGKHPNTHIEPRLIMPLSLSYDHRIVDGADAARFLNDVKDFLAAPGRLLLAP